jgi:hypothetical protein
MDIMIMVAPQIVKNVLILVKLVMEVQPDIVCPVKEKIE